MKYPLLRSYLSNIYTVPNNRDWQGHLNSKHIYWNGISVIYRIKKIVYRANLGRTHMPQTLIIDIVAYTTTISTGPRAALAAPKTGCCYYSCDGSVTVPVSSESLVSHSKSSESPFDWLSHSGGHVPATKKAGRTTISFST